MTDDPTKSYISSIQLPGSTVEDFFKDEEARAAITVLESKGMHYLGITTTVLTDGATTTPIVILKDDSTTETVTPVRGDFVFYKNASNVKTSFLYSGSVWFALDNTITGLGALAYADTASGSYTPAGTITKPDISVDTTSQNLDTATITVDTENDTLVITTGSASVIKTATASMATNPVFTGTSATITVSAGSTDPTRAKVKDAIKDINPATGTAQQVLTALENKGVITTTVNTWEELLNAISAPRTITTIEQFFAYYNA